MKQILTKFALLSTYAVLAIPSLANADVPCKGGACGDIQITWDSNGCVNVASFSDKHIVVHLGNTVSVQFTGKDHRVIASPFGGCIKSYSGDTTADYN